MLENIHERLSYVISQIQSRTKKTKKILAEEIGISPSALTQLTNGKSSTPSEATLASLKEKFGVNPKWLINGSSDSAIEAFYNEEGFSNLREEIRIVKDSGYEDTYIVATMKGWAGILDYLSNAGTAGSSINKQLISKAKTWNGIGKSIRPLLGSPVFFDNYSRDNELGRVYAQTIFYLQGTPPRGFIIASAKMPSSIIGATDDSINQYDNRIILECKKVLSANWEVIPLKGKNCTYYLDLSHSEYLSVMTKKIPENYLADIIK